MFDKAAEAGLDVSIESGIATLTLNRPESRNAISLALSAALLEVLKRVAQDPQVRAVVITGAGKLFCAGGDLSEVAGTTPLDIRARINNGARQWVRLIGTMHKPVLCALNGPAAGAGVGLALACDHIIAVEEASFVIAFGKIGLIPDAATLQAMVQNIGLLRAKEIVFNAEPVSAARAAQLGLYNRVVPRAEFADAVRAQAEAFAHGPTVAIGMAKVALKEAARMTYDAFMDLEANSQALAISTEDHKEGMAAFREKRNPFFRGF
ncbi:MAG: enoyl-CoA hydratase-related protein [Pseudomonadota bacterium]|nr:enoyl-CoA hydratase-related protein [Pseudomonadota bacterium]